MNYVGSLIGLLVLGGMLGCTTSLYRVQLERGATTPPQNGNYSQLVRVTPGRTEITDSNGLRVLRVVPIRYPADYRFYSVSRDVVMIATVRRDGQVRRVRLVTGREIAEFWQNTEIALLRWQFQRLPRELDVQVSVIFTPYD